MRTAIRSRTSEPLMVMRRVSRFDGGPPATTLAAFRRTPVQALGRGLFAGAVGGVVLVLVSAAAMGVRWVSGGSTPPHALMWAILAFLAPLATGALVGLTIGVRVGVDADDLGLRGRPSAHPTFVPWLDIVDIRAERRRMRTVVVVRPKEGVPLQLLAPYDGGALSHDPNFERKFFRLLNLWETHRNWRNACNPT